MDILAAGCIVQFRAHRSKPGKGLSYDAGSGTLAEDCTSEGWDVVDLTDGRSVYAFSIERGHQAINDCDARDRALCRRSATGGKDER